MKRAMIMFWNGLTGILAGIANWFTIVLGMQDDSKYGKFIRRIVGTCFAFVMLVIACGAGYGMFKYIYEKWSGNPYFDDSYYDGQYLSRNATYYSRDGRIDGFVETRDGKKTVKGIHWIAKPLGADSLVCYSNGKVRGYFNMLTGEIAIEPKYKHAWVFSDGLAAVDDNGWIKFIDAKNNVVIDLKMPYLTGAEGYVFHNGHCVVHNDKRDKFGLIDKKGNWAMKPEYDVIFPEDSFFVVGKGGMQSVVSHHLKTVLPLMKAKFSVSGGVIIATMDDHTLCTYNLTGELMDNFHISSIEKMMYDADEAMASCKKYEAEVGWFGLLSPSGKVLTPPVYSEITAIGYNLFFCKRDDYRGELLNENGQRVR